MPEDADSPIVPQDNPPEQQPPPRPPLFVAAPSAPTLPPFDRLRPPEPADLPRLLSPAQVAVVFGISVESARNDGNRDKLGKPTVIDGLKVYQAADVVRRWHERYGAKPEKSKANRGEQPNGLTEQHDLVVRVTAAIERIADGGGSQGEVMATQARMLEAQQQEIKRLTELLEAERGKANNAPKTFWRRLFGG